jgi:hypothetical protein
MFATLLGLGLALAVSFCIAFLVIVALTGVTAWSSSKARRSHRHGDQSEHRPSDQGAQADPACRARSCSS